MPNITLTFTNDINVSAQVGDTIYSCELTALGGFDTSTSDTDNSNLTEIGTISAINASAKTITCSSPTMTTETKPSVGNFILFSKDNQVNVASPLGYYAQVKFKNDSTKKSEMFSAACEIFESSK